MDDTFWIRGSIFFFFLNYVCREKSGPTIQFRVLTCGQNVMQKKECKLHVDIMSLLPSYNGESDAEHAKKK